MKFLIAASFMCLALVGQIQGGSLRGLEVQKPHLRYGPPLEETKPIPDDEITTTIEEHKEPIILPPSPEYGTPAVVAQVENIPFEDSLPNIGINIDFGTPSNTYVPPTTPKPQIPHLTPGLPTLPTLPTLPENTYVPPTTPKPHIPHLKPGLPILPALPSLPENSIISIQVTVPELPSLPSFFPSITQKPELPHLEPGLPVSPEVPSYPSFLPTQKPELPHLEPGLPALPEAPVVPEPVPWPITEASNAYLPPPIEVTPAPVEIEEPHTPSDAYRPPPIAVVEEVKPEYPHVVELPQLPAVPEVPVEEQKPGGYHYNPPAIAFNLPKVTVHSPKPAAWTEQIKSVLYKAPSVAKVHLESHFIDIPTKHSVAEPALPVKTIEHYNTPTKDIFTPLSVPNLHGLVSHSEFSQNQLTSSASTSSHQVNRFVVPSYVQPTITQDAVLVEAVNPFGPGYTLQSIHSGNSEKTSMESFNHQLSAVGHEFPHLSSFGAQW